MSKWTWAGKDNGSPSTSGSSVAYYNDNEPYVCGWLYNLAKGGMITDGLIDCKDIQNVRPEHLEGFDRCHFFAGIGGWELALELAGWPRGLEVWTGSCPCQPFSVAGRRKGTADVRHLWPEFRRLIAERRPAIVFGEQVAGKDGLAWAEQVRLDMESINYTFGVVDITAASVGANHARSRLYWVAYAASMRRQSGIKISYNCTSIDRVTSVRSADRLDAKNGLACDSVFEGFENQPQPEQMVNGVSTWAPCLRAYGNSIVPQVAAEFIKACMETTGIRPEYSR